jgi:hypothetical protein
MTGLLPNGDAMVARVFRVDRRKLRTLQRQEQADQTRQVRAAARVAERQLDELVRITHTEMDRHCDGYLCPACGTVHFWARCPACDTPYLTAGNSPVPEVRALPAEPTTAEQDRRFARRVGELALDTLAVLHAHARRAADEDRDNSATYEFLVDEITVAIHDLVADVIRRRRSR